MVDKRVDSSLPETAVPEVTSVLLITKTEAVQQYITEVLSQEHPDLGAFSLQVTDHLVVESQDIRPDIFLLDEALLEEMPGNTAVYQNTFPAIILTRTQNVQPLSTDKLWETYALTEDNIQTTLPHIIQKTIRKARQEQKKLRQQALAEALQDTSSSLNIAWDFDQELDYILTQIDLLIPYDKVNIMLIDGDHTKAIRFWGYENYAHVADDPYVLADTPALQEMVDTKKPLLISDVHTYENWIERIPTTRSWLAAPVLIDSDVYAFICLDKREPNYYQGKHLDLLAIFAERVALTMEKAQLYASKQRQLDELSALHKLALLSAEASDENELIDKMTQLIGAALYPDNFGVLLLDEQEENLLTHPSYQVKGEPVIFQSIPATQGIVGYVVRTKRPYISSDITQDKYYLQGSSKTHSEICVPFFLGDRLGGVINAESNRKKAFSAADERLMMTLANQLGVGIERMRLFALEQQRRKEAEILREAAMTLNAALNVDNLLAKLLDFLVQLVPYDSGNVMLLEEDGRLHIKCIHGYAESSRENVLSYTFDIVQNKIFAHIFQTKKSYLIDDTTQAADWEQQPESTYVRSWLGVPLLVGDKVIGCYSIERSVPNGFTATDVKLAEALSSQTAVSLQNIQLIQLSQKAAMESNIANSISQSLNAAPDVFEVFPELSKALRHLTNCDFITIFLGTEKQERGALILLEDTSNRNRAAREIIETKEAAAAADVFAGVVHQTPDMSLEVEGYPATKRLYELGVRSRINIPLSSGSKIIGSLNLGWTEKNAYQVQQIPLLGQIANAITLALERSRLFEEIKQWAQYLTLLHEFGRKITEVVEIETLCQTAVSYLTRSFHYPGISVLLTDEKNQELILYAIEGVNKERTPPHHYRQKYGEGIIGQVALQKSRVHVRDTTSYPHFIPSPRIDVKSEIALPLFSGDILYGVLDVNSDQIDAFNEDDLAILTIVADQLAISLSKAHLFAQTVQHNVELELLLDLSASLRAANNIDEIVPTILQQTLKMTNGIFSSVYLVEETSGELVERGNHPLRPELLGRRNKMGEGITGYVAQTGEIYVTQDLAADPRAKLTPEEVELLLPIGHSVSLPLKTQKHIVGVLHIGFTEQQGVSEKEIRLLTAVSEIGGTAIERAFMMETLEQRVTERTSELADANERLKELDKLKSKFVADVSHELRTPIANLMLYLDLIEQGDPRRQEHYLSVLRHQAQRLTNLIEDILNLSRIELGRDKISFHAFDLNQVIDVVSAAHLPSVEAANLELSVQLEPNLPKLYGERNQLAQVVANLLANAINYTLSGKIDISTSWHSETGEVWLVVADSGMGIPPEDLSHLFDRFYRGKSVSQSTIPGTGLGLAIVKEIVDLHAGKIVVESEVGVGTTFTVKFLVYAGASA